MKRFFFVLYLCLGIFSGLGAQVSSLSDYVVRNWTTADGLPANTINGIIQSKDGYIYAGTYEGLVRFDGFDFTILKRSPGNKYNFSSARSIFQDSRGNLWIGANDEGVQKISGSDSVFYTTQDGLPNNSIRAIAEDKSGNVWIGTAAGIVYITADGVINYPAGLGGVNSSQVLVENLYCDTAGRIWLLSNDLQGIFYYVGDSFKRFNDFSSFGEFFFTAIGQDKNGFFWFGLGNQGIARSINGKTERLVTNTILDSVATYKIYCDDFGSIWFGSDKGIVLYKDGKFFEYKVNPSLPENPINSIVGDREGNIWVGTTTKGLLKLSPGKFRTISFPSVVNAIYEDNDSLLWLACDDGLFCLENESFISNEITEYCKGLRIRHVGGDSEGNLLICAYSEPGFILYNKDEGIKTWTTEEGLAGYKTRVAVETSAGDYYVGTTTGLSVIKKDGSIKAYHRNLGFETEYIMCIYEDDEGLIWVGTDGGGVYIMNHDAIIDKITSENGLVGNVIFKIIQDEQGFFWICTGTGVSRVNKTRNELLSANSAEKIVNYTSEQGFVTNSIFQMLIDYTGSAWMISNAGVFEVSLADLNKIAAGELSRIDSKFYNKNDGLKTDGFTSTALSTCDKNGRLLFTLVDGIAIYDPLRISNKEILPIVHVENLKIDNEVVEDFSREIIIPPRTKRIEIKYTALSFNSPERTRFSYMLGGYDEDYCSLTPSRIATYTGLRPGTYKFKLKAYNSEGEFSESVENVVLIQAPLLYQRKAFWIIFAVVIFAVIGIVFYFRDRAAKINALRLETKIQERTVELEMAKDETDKLLKNILPESIAERLKSAGYSPVNSGSDIEELSSANNVNTSVEISDEFEEVSFEDIVSDAPEEKRVQIADKFDNVTVLFSDIVGFTNTTSNASAEDIVSSLNDLFYRFDIRAEKMGIEKIKTIGDAYMAACGVPTPDSDHYLKMIEFAKGMYADLEDYNKTAKIKFNLRVGVNSGPVIAGVIGKNKFIYDLWGDTVNVASRMESLCKPGSIRITESVQKLLNERSAISSCLEEECEVKGKGKMKTFEIEL